MTATYVSLYPHPNEKDDPLAVKMQMQAHPRYDTTYVPVDSLTRFRYLTYNNSGAIGAGNIISTTGDLLLFDRAYFAGRLLKQSSMEEAFTPLKLNDGSVYYSKEMDTMPGEGKMSYGLGWEILEQPAFGKSVGHGGFKFGLATYFLHNLARDQAIIAYDNTAGTEFGRIIGSAQLLLNGAQPLALRTKRSLVTAYGMALVKQGPDHAASIFQSLKSDTSRYYLNEWEMNDLGYHLFYAATFQGHQQLALEAFKLATFIFPDSFNPYDSYGQLLKETGNKQDAILMYRRSILLNPKNEDGIKTLNELLNTK
jgi:tetratricopeptide (TPR) repeat protein